MEAPDRAASMGAAAVVASVDAIARASGRIGGWCTGHSRGRGHASWLGLHGHRGRRAVWRGRSVKGRH